MRKLLFLLAFSALGLSAAAAASPVPRFLNMGEVFTANDYPQVAQRNNQEGNVEVILDVDRTGTVTSCRIKRSSGHVSLDEQTCALFRARARFEPARNGSGRTVDSKYERLIVWRLEGDPPQQQLLPRQAWVVKTVIALDAQRRVVSCTVEAVGVSGVEQDCPPVGSVADVPAGSEAVDAITETYFYPVELDRVTAPADRTDATKLAQQISSLEIDADGRVSACQGMRYSGAASPDNDACRFTLNLRFTLAAAPTISKGTLVVKVYVRQQTHT